MDLRQLAALTAVADAGSFSAAARRLHTVQSNVSTHVARLEAELGATLVDRSTGTLTEEGDVVVPRARRIQHELESLRADVDSLLHEVSGAVRLGCIGTVSRWLVPRLLHGHGGAPPQGPRRRRRRHHHLAGPPARRPSSLDLAVINLPLGGGELATEPLFDEDRIILAPLDHPLAAEATVELAAAGRPLRCCSSRRARRSATSSTTRCALIGVELEGPGRDRRHPPAHLPGLRGFGPAMVPATAGPPWMGVGVPARHRRAASTPRSVGLASPRRGRLSAPARAVRDVVRGPRRGAPSSRASTRRLAA